MAHNGHVFKKYRRLDLGACLREILTASFWRSAHRDFKVFESGRPRWNLALCWHMGLFMALEAAATVQERFENARESVTQLFDKRRRCGSTLAGFTGAMSEFPLPFIQRVKQAAWRKLEETGIEAAKAGRWLAYGIDGSIQNIPRTQLHEEAYGISTKGTSSGAGSPQRQVVAAVAMGKNMLWDWECSGALVGEREQSLKIMARLPQSALGVLDAGFLGYEWARSIAEMGRFFLVRVGGNVRLWVEGLNKTMSAEWRDREVWLWPDKKRGHPPVVLRLIRIEAESDSGKKCEMWLATNVLDATQLTREEASGLYDKRWGACECTFRDLKDTLDARKLDSRTPAMTEREEEFELMAMQLLQVTVLVARKQSRKERRRNRRVSVAKAQRIWRRAARRLAAGKSTRWFKAEMLRCVGDDYKRNSKKVRRPWPQRKAHESPKAPIFRRLTKTLKVIGDRNLCEEKRMAG